MPTTTGNADWKDDFKNKHVNSGSATDFISSFKTVIYAKRASGLSSTSEEVDDFKAIGVVQQYGWSENKQLDYIFELGSDIPYIVPGRTIGNINLARILLFGNDIVNALYGNDTFSGTEVTRNGSDKVINSIKDITEPLDILFVAYKGEGTSGAEKYSKVFKNCHISSRAESISAGSVIISESVQIGYENIVGVTISGNGSSK